MTDIFGKILEMSVVAGVTIAVVLLARLALSKAPKKYSYMLWSVAAFRLVCPVSFHSAFSLFRIFERAGKSTEFIPADKPPVSSAVIPSVSVVVPAQPSTTVPPVVDDVTVSVASEINVMTILAAIWCIGIAAMLIFAAISYAKTVKQFSNAVLLKDNIWQSDKVRSPVIVGLVRPRIYVPFGLGEETLRYALAHERCHLRRLDHIVRPLAYLILLLHWFNPLCWLAYFLMISDMEMSCDEAVLKRNEDAAKAYSATLLSFAVNKRFPLPNHLYLGGTDVKKRIENILKWKKPGILVGVVAVILCVVVVIACASDPKTGEEQRIPNLTVSCETNEVPANWYVDGNFEFEYDELNVLTAKKGCALSFKTDFTVDTLTVGEDLYLKSGDVTTIQKRTLALEKTEAGEFILEIDDGVAAKQAVYFIPYNEGKFVIKVLFEEVSPDHLVVPCAYTLPEYYGATELDAKIWAHMQMPESDVLQLNEIPVLACSEHAVAEEWRVIILDEEYDPYEHYNFCITDTEGMFTAFNICGWEKIYDGIIDRYIDEIGPELYTADVTYDIILAMDRLILQFITGTDVCGYKFLDDETGRSTEVGVARIPAGTAEAIYEFASGFAS